MFFSAKLIEELVTELAIIDELQSESVQNLIYHLKLPGPAIPNYIASVIAEKPRIGRTPNHLPGRLAYGILDDALLIFNTSDRYNHQKKLCRKIERIKLALERLGHPVRLIEVFDHDLAIMVFAAEATSDLGAKPGELSKAELATLVERILEAFLLENELTTLLLGRISNQLKTDGKKRLESRVCETIKEGIKNEPWDDTASDLPIFNLNEPVRFRQTLIESESFEKAAWETMEQVTRLCRC